MQKKDTEGLEEDLQNIDWIGGTALHMLILLNCIIMSLFINNDHFTFRLILQTKDNSMRSSNYRH